MRHVLYSFLVTSPLIVGCAGVQDPADDDPTGGKADGLTPLLTCTQSKAASDAKLTQKLVIYDQGLASSVPTGLPSTLDDYIIKEGFPVRQYRVKTKLAVNGGSAQSLDKTYYGSLYNTGGYIVTKGTPAYEVNNYSSHMSVTVSVNSSTEESIALACTGTLPTEAQAKGPNSQGLALTLRCSTQSIPAHPAVNFHFDLIRIDSITAINFGDKNDPPIVAPSGSDEESLNENWTIGRTSQRIVIGGDSDGFAYTHLKLTVPHAAGDTVTGTFAYDDAEDNTKDYSQTVSCTTATL